LGKGSDVRQYLGKLYFLMRRHYMAIRVGASLLVILPLFQNCSPVYKSKATIFQSTNESSTGENPGGGDPGGGGNPGGTPQVAYKFSCYDASKRGLSETETRRLNRDELLATLQDLFGGAIYAGLTTELQGLPGDAIKERMTEFKQMHSEAHAQAMLAISMKAADLIVDDTNQLKTFVAACVAGSGVTLTQVCVQNFIRDFGLKVIRRPLTTEEMQTYINLYAAGTTPQEGVKMVIMGLLQSPYFLFLVEQGSNQINAGRTRLTDYEIASRLSYRLIGTMPDSELFAAASRGELQVLDNVKAHAERLAQTEKMKNRVEVFFNYWARLNDFPAFTFSNNFLDGINITGLRDEVLTETREFIRYVVWDQKGSVKDLFSSTAAFIRSDRMAQLYNAPKMTGNQPVALDAERAGILLRPGFLAGGTDTTTPIGRGVMIRRKVLCDNLPSPSADIISTRLGEIGKLDPLTMSNRQIVATATSPALCMNCHSMINPIGFAFEAYDGLGRKRTVEKVYDHTTHELVAQHPIDTRVDGLTLDNSTAISVSSAGEIVAQMATGVKGPACMATHIYRYARLRNEVSGDDDCALSDMEHAIKDSGGSILGAFIRNVANDDIFWKKSI